MKKKDFNFTYTSRVTEKLSGNAYCLSPTAFIFTISQDILNMSKNWSQNPKNGTN